MRCSVFRNFMLCQHPRPLQPKKQVQREIDMLMIVRLCNEQSERHCRC